MLILDQAKAFLDRITDLGDEWREKLQALPDGVQEAFWALRKASCFVEANRRPDCRSEYPSPGGNYKLVVDYYAPGKGYGNHTRGQVFHQSSDEPVATVYRNYSAFPFLWVEHPNGHLYLVCGEDYQGQTVLEVDTGARKDFLPKEAKEGFGFCWTAYKFDVATQILIVDGCYWACPYMYRFFDFSNPISGWPELENEHWVDVDDRWPELNVDGRIRCFKSESSDDDSSEDTLAITTFKRVGLKLELEEEWVSDKEKASRAARDEAQKQYDDWLENFKATDPLYLEFNRLVEGFDYAKQYGLGIGQTYDGWCPHWQGAEKRICRNVLQQQKGRDLTVKIEWGAETGPIKLIVCKGDQKQESFYEHSLEGMQAAFADIPSEARA